MERPAVSAVIAGASARDIKMTKTIAIAAALLLGTASFASAQTHSATKSPGASSYSPGHEVKKSDTKGPGASELSPGHRMKESGTVGQARGRARGASELSPGDQM